MEIFNQKKTKTTTKNVSRLMPSNCDLCNKKAEFIVVISGAFTGKTTIKCFCKDCMQRWDSDKLEV